MLKEDQSGSVIRARSPTGSISKQRRLLVAREVFAARANACTARPWRYQDLRSLLQPEAHPIHRSTLRESRRAGLVFRAKLHHISSEIFCTVRIDRALTTV